MTALERKIIEQARVVVHAEILFGMNSSQHRHQVTKLAKLQRQLPIQ